MGSGVSRSKPVDEKSRAKDYPVAAESAAAISRAPVALVPKDTEYPNLSVATADHTDSVRPNAENATPLYGNEEYLMDDMDDGLENDMNRSFQSENEAANAEMFAVTAMSLGMENDDLLFNLLYFGGGADDANINFGNMFNTAMEETVALYSANNTPYKLKPASVDSLNGLPIHLLASPLAAEDNECAVCKDELEVGCEVVLLPSCSHLFHHECIVRWLKLQGWCPVCRAPIDAPSVSVSVSVANDVTEGPEKSHDACACPSTAADLDSWETAADDSPPSHQHRHSSSVDSRDCSKKLDFEDCRVCSRDDCGEDAPSQSHSQTHSSTAPSKSMPMKKLSLCEKERAADSCGRRSSRDCGPEEVLFDGKGTPRGHFVAEVKGEGEGAETYREGEEARAGAVAACKHVADEKTSAPHTSNNDQWDRDLCIHSVDQLEVKGLAEGMSSKSRQLSPRGECK